MEAITIYTFRMDLTSTFAMLPPCVAFFSVLR